MSEAAVIRVNGPVVDVDGLGAAMSELVEIGPQRLPGEVIGLRGATATVQVYEYTGGLRPGDPAFRSGHPLTVEIGPGLLGGVFDGMLRRLDGAGDMLTSARRDTLVRDRRWSFVPAAGQGSDLEPGALLGRVRETAAVEFRVLVPADAGGRVDWIAGQGEFTVSDRIATVDGQEILLAHSWPVRRARPVRERLRASRPLTTGQRVIDLLFPIARGSTAAVPGGFGTGKTVLLQQIAKWCDADVIVYVGCGERGNEMADVLQEIAELEDPRTGQSLLDRTILIANTSNMPVLAREASIYTGVTIAEAFRDMGYETVVIADSTSRWAEALREVASRTGELPAEEGYPAGLASALAAFYERAGCVRTLSGSEASVTILGAISPPGGDMTEPVSAHTRRFVRCVWSLDPNLAYAREYPAISWHDSSSRDAELVAAWYARQQDPAWARRREEALQLLEEAERLQSIAELVGTTSLPDRERVVLLAARLLRDAVLEQSSLSPNDAYSDPHKQAALLRLALDLYQRMLELVARGVAAGRLEALDLSAAVRVRDEAASDGAEDVQRVEAELLERLGELA
jgi:V/A-type H+-transporting ATPase subunit A